MAILLRAIVFIEGPIGERDGIVALVVDAGGEVVERRDGLIIASFESARACVRVCRQLSGPVRAGVSCGDIAVEGDSVQGVPVIEASRLKDYADRGQTLCAERLLRLCAGDEHLFRRVGPLPLKGLGPPLDAAEIQRARS